MALKDGPANGYEVMSRLEARSRGEWRPSPGSVYPTLQMLEDEGLVTSTSGDGSRTYELTDAGTEQANAEEADASGRAPWDRMHGGDERVVALRDAVLQTMMAARQVAAAGHPDQLDRGIAIVQQAKKELYGLLAEE